MQQRLNLIWIQNCPDFLSNLMTFIRQMWPLFKIWPSKRNQENLEIRNQSPSNWILIQGRNWSIMINISSSKILAKHFKNIEGFQNQLLNEKISLLLTLQWFILLWSDFLCWRIKLVSLTVWLFFFLGDSSASQWFRY